MFSFYISANYQYDRIENKENVKGGGSREGKGVELQDPLNQS